jgi:hypothetical protein
VAVMAQRRASVQRGRAAWGGANGLCFNKKSVLRSLEKDFAMIKQSIHCCKSASCFQK